MKIAFNPSTVAALTTPPNNKDITFDLRGRNIFARGVKFYGTDTNTWRDIKINNVSIGSHTLDLRNGSNTTLTNTDGVVTINSTWRPVVDNLTSDSTTSSLSAKQGKVLKALIDGKSNSDHNHDGRYVRYYAVTTLDCNNLAVGLTAARISATNAAHTNHSAYLYISDVGTPFQIQIPDSSIPYIYKRYYGSGKWSGWFKLNAGYADSAGSVAWANVTGKPSSYTPSAHTHAWNSLTHSSTTENQAILTNGKANGWKLQTLNIARWDNAANNAHSHANKSVLDGITSALVNSWNTAYNFVSNITGTDTDKVINKWEEIVNFLAGITEDNKLNTLLNSKLSVYELADKTNVGTIKNNGIYYSTTDASSGTLTNSPFNNGFTLINMTSYDGGDDLRRSRLAFNAYGEIKVSDDRGQANTAETWYNVLTSKNSGINGSTIKLNGTSITVYSSGTTDGRYVKKSGDTMTGVLTIDTTNFGALTIKRNDDANGASIQFRGKSSVYGYIGLNNITKDKQFLRWSSDTSRVYTILDTSSTYISNGKGVINGTTITQVDNATNSTNSTNARKLVNWYSARPTSLNAQFGDGSLRIFYATSSTTEGKPAEDSHILHLAWDNTGGYDAQLAVHARSGKVSTRAQNDGTWQPWKTLAFTTDIPSSLKNPYSFNVFGVVYDGSAAKTVTTSNFISQVNEGTSTITDGTMLITSYASNSGFADTNAVNVPYKRKAIHLWEYIKAKTDSLYATKGHNHDDRYLRLTGGWMSGDINFGGDNKIYWGRNTDYASISFKNDGDGDANSYMSFVTSDNGNEYFRWSHSSGYTNTEWMALRSDGLRVRGTKVSLEGHSHNDLYYTKVESNAKYITDIATSVNKLTFTRNGSNIARNITVNIVYSQGNLTNISNKDNTTKASSGLYIYNSYNQVIGTNSYSSVLSINTGGTIQIAGNWGDDQTRNLYWRSQSDRNVADYPWKSWRTILDSENYSFTLDSRYYTESEVNSLLDAKLNRQNLSYGTWNPRGYHLAADYHYNGGDLSISESGGKIHVSVDGYFWQNEGQYRVLDTSDVAGLKGNLTVHQYLSATDAAWYPLVWGGNSHLNTSDSTGAVYKSYDKLSWQTSSQTLYATNIQTNNIKNLSIGGGVYWNPYVEDVSDNTDAASITLVKSGVAGGTTLVLSQMNDTNDTIQFKTNTAARLYHNSYPILTTQNTYVSNNKGYINGTEITQVNNSDKVDNRHAISTTPNTGIIYKAAIYTAYSLTSYWVRLASIPSISQNGEFVATIHVQSGHSGFGRNAILLVYLRGGASSYLAKGFNICCNSNYDPIRFRLYYKDSDKTSEIWYNTVGQWDGIITTVISQSSEGSLYEGLTLYSGVITAVQTPSMSTYLSAQVSTITDNISGNASTATKLQTPRTIWGQSFDGTADVRGTLSGVANIQFSADGAYDIGSNSAASRYIYTHWLGAKSGSKLELGANNSGYGKGLCIDTNLNVGIGTNSPAYKLHVNGTFRATNSTVSDLFVNTGDATLKIYTGITADDWNDGNICFQTSINATDGQSHAYPTEFQHRCNIVLQPRGGQVYIGTNPGTGNTTYKLYVNSKIFSNGGFVKNGSSDSYVLLGGGGHKLESSLNVAYSKYLTGITLTGGDSNNAGYRLIFEKTMGGWYINYGVWAIAFRHSGRGTLNIGFDTTNSDGSTYIYNIRFLGSTASRESTPFRAFYNSTTKVFRIYWHYYDYTSGDIAVLRGNMVPHNGTWMASLPNDVGTELAITCNMADQAANADTVDGYHANGLLTALSNSNNGISITVGGTTKSVSNISVNYASSAGNANTLDGYPANGSNGAPYGHIPTIESDGVMEVGKYIDFHNDNNGKHDFSTRLQSTGNYGNEVNLPSASGTLALTSDILNYYWANVKISASSSTTTSPTVSNLTATSSIKMGNISLEHTDEINNSTNGGLHLNYRNSGNVSLCQGGGSVGIGTTSPTQKLDVIGNIRATGQLYLPTNGNYNAILMGDDCWMGDCNIGNVIGLSGRGNANAGGIKFGKGGMYIGYNGSSHYSSGTSLWTNFNADTVDGEHASNFSYTHQSSFDFSKRKSGRIVTFDQPGTDYGWINGFASTHNNYLTSIIFNTHRSSNWYVGYMEGDMSTGETNGLQAVHKLAFADGDESYPIFLGYLNLYNGNDGTISSSFPCLGYSVPFTYTRGGAYCLINIPNTSFQTFYIKAAIASVHYSGAGMDHWVGNHRGDGAWWLHCDAVGSNAVQVKGFHLADKNNDSWWGGNPLYSGDGAAKIITVCLFGHVKYK